MTPDDHANIVREAIGADVDVCGSEERERAALAALDTLQAQAETAAKWEFIAAERGVRMDEIQARAEAAEAERDRLADALRQIVDGVDHEGLGVLPSKAFAAARAALAETEHTP